MSTDPIISALDEQVACYRRLAKLAEAQHECIQHEQTEKLIEVLARRQEVLDRITGLEKTVGLVKRQWPQYLATLDPARRQRADALLAETRQLLERITSADRDDVLVLQQRKVNLGRQIAQTSAARTVNRSYAAAAYGARPPRMDLQR